MGILPAWMSVHLVPGAHISPKRELYPQELEQVVVSCHAGTGNLPSPLQEEQVLLVAEPSLQTVLYLFLFCFIILDNPEVTVQIDFLPFGCIHSLPVQT